MNIFKWHEEQTPEELAIELGISNLAIIEKASKKITETFQKPTTSKINDFFDLRQLLDSDRTITCEDIQDHYQLAIGKKVISSNGETWIITFLLIENDTFSITINFFQTNNPYTKNITSFEELKNNFQISKNNIIDSKSWKKPSKFWDLQEDMLVKFWTRPASVLWKIVFISEETDTITVRNLSLNSISNDDYDFEEFVDNCFFCTEKIYIKIQDTEQFWTDKFEFSNLQVGMTIKSKKWDEQIITKINNKDEILSKRDIDSSHLDSILTYEEIKKNKTIHIAELDRLRPNKRIMLSDIIKTSEDLFEEIIKEWTYLYCESDDKFDNTIWKIIRSTGSSYEFLFYENKKFIHKTKIINNFAIHKNILAHYLLEKISSDDSNYESASLTRIEDFWDIKLGDKVLSLKWESIIYEIINIWPGPFTENKNSITLNDGEFTSVVNIEYLKENYFLIVHNPKSQDSDYIDPTHT